LLLLLLFVFLALVLLSTANDSHGSLLTLLFGLEVLDLSIGKFTLEFLLACSSKLLLLETLGSRLTVLLQTHGSLQIVDTAQQVLADVHLLSVWVRQVLHGLLEHGCLLNFVLLALFKLVLSPLDVLHMEDEVALALVVPLCLVELIVQFALLFEAVVNLVLNVVDLLSDGVTLGLLIGLLLIAGLHVLSEGFNLGVLL